MHARFTPCRKTQMVFVVYQQCGEKVMAHIQAPRPASWLRRSLDVYYRDTERTARMDALNRQFVPDGGLAFDIGAHVGDRTASFLRMGARVVALEPQPGVFRALRLLLSQSDDVTLLPYAAGRAEGETTLHLNTQNPTVTTAATAFIAAADGVDGWQDEVWDDSAIVPVTTLDALISGYGVPDFVKIDVEGFEADVLMGLSTAIPAVSFEFTTIQRDCAAACMERLRALGDYKFNLSLGEAHSLCFDAWLSAGDMCCALDALPDSANSGDVYARLG